ncbi:uncharacterized protein LOC111715219, partial [Eurytemora carolleeae]|uniref:uncharacterized protein LOC111715219 n=1 Tax=Eurytemora carolleeae TaxID=1294199 RepID=UPI000C76B02F
MSLAPTLPELTRVGVRRAKPLHLHNISLDLVGRWFRKTRFIKSQGEGRNVQRTRIIKSSGFWTRSRVQDLRRAEVRAIRKWSRFSRTNRMRNPLRILIHAEFKKFGCIPLDATQVLARIVHERDLERRRRSSAENIIVSTLHKEYLELLENEAGIQTFEEEEGEG